MHFFVYGSRIVAEMHRQANLIEDSIFSLMYQIPFTLCQCTFYIPKSKFPYLRYYGHQHGTMSRETGAVDLAKPKEQFVLLRAWSLC
jgi:hypothetical protein